MDGRTETPFSVEDTPQTNFNIITKSDKKSLLQDKYREVFQPSSSVAHIPNSEKYHPAPCCDRKRLKHSLIFDGVSNALSVNTYRLGSNASIFRSDIEIPVDLAFLAVTLLQPLVGLLEVATVELE